MYHTLPRLSTYFYKYPFGLSISLFLTVDLFPGYRAILVAQAQDDALPVAGRGGVIP